MGPRRPSLSTGQEPLRVGHLQQSGLGHPQPSPGTAAPSAAQPHPHSYMGLLWLWDKIQGPGGGLSVHLVTAACLAVGWKGWNLPKGSSFPPSSPSHCICSPLFPGNILSRSVPTYLRQAPGNCHPRPCLRPGLLGTPGADLSQQRWLSPASVTFPSPSIPSRDDNQQELDVGHSLASSALTAFLFPHTIQNVLSWGSELYIASVLCCRWHPHSPLAVEPEPRA